MPKLTYRQQLLSTKTVASIARDVHKQETPKLIKRQYLYGAYNPRSNEWTHLPVGGTIDPNSDIIDFDTIDSQVCLSEMRIQDISTQTNNFVADDPDTMRNETLQAAADGPNVLAPQFALNGKRLTDQIEIHALSIFARLRVVRVAASIYTDKVTFKFGVYTWRKIDANGYLDDVTTPDVKSICKWLPIGYSAQLDNLNAGMNFLGIPYAVQNLNMILNNEKVKTLFEKEVTINVSSIVGSVNCKELSFYHELKNAVKIMYDPSAANQDGARHLNQKVIFAVRSNCPSTQMNIIQPRAMFCTKLYYTNIT